MEYNLTEESPRVLGFGCPYILLIWVDKENLIKFSLDSLHYLYNYYMVCVLFSHTPHVTCDVTLSYTPSCVVSPKEKKKKSEYK